MTEKLYLHCQIFRFNFVWTVKLYNRGKHNSTLEIILTQFLPELFLRKIKKKCIAYFKIVTKSLKKRGTQIFPINTPHLNRKFRTFLKAKMKLDKRNVNVIVVVFSCILKKVYNETKMTRNRTSVKCVNTIPIYVLCPVMSL